MNLSISGCDNSGVQSSTHLTGRWRRKRPRNLAVLVCTIVIFLCGLSYDAFSPSNYVHAAVIQFHWTMNCRPYGKNWWKLS